MITLAAVFTASCASEPVLPMHPLSEDASGQMPVQHMDEAELTASPAGSESGGKKLRVGTYSFADYSHVFEGWLWEIEDFWAELHPDVAIEFIDYADPNDRWGGVYDYATRMSVLLMSGTAPDVFDLSLLRADKLFDGGFAVDLYPFIQADPDVSLDDYFPNITSVLDLDGRLFTLPSSIFPSTILVNRDYADIVKEIMGDKVTMNYLDMIRCYEAVLNSGVSRNELYISDAWTQSDGHRYVTFMEGPRFFDMRNETVNFGPDFINAMNTIEPFLINRDEIMFDGTWPINTLFVQNSIGNLSQFFDETTAHTPVTLPFLSESSAGYAKMHNQSSMYVINSQSSLKEAAWDYIKYRHTSPEIRRQEAGYGLPAKMSEFKDLISANLGFRETDDFIRKAVDVNDVWIIEDDFFAALKTEVSKYTETEMGLVYEAYLHEPWYDWPEDDYTIIYLTQTMYDEHYMKVNESISGSASEFALRLENMIKAVNYWDLDLLGPDTADDFRMLSEGIITVEQLAGSIHEKYTLYIAQ